MPRAALGTLIIVVFALRIGGPDPDAAAAPVDPLPSWHDGVAKRRICDFVANVTTPGPGYLPPEKRIVLFEGDGTLWTDHPVSFARSLRVNPIRHPATGKRYTELVYAPMTELLEYLRANGFTTYIVAGRDVEVIRPWASRAFDVSPRQIVRSRAAITGDPVMAFVSSDAEFSMLARTTAAPGAQLGVIVDHTDARRDDARVVHLLADAPARGWLVVDVARDWRRVYPPRPWPEH